MFLISKLSSSLDVRRDYDLQVLIPVVLSQSHEELFLQQTLVYYIQFSLDKTVRLC